MEANMKANMEANNVISSASGIVASGVTSSHGTRLSSRILAYLSLNEGGTPETIAGDLEVGVADVVSKLNVLKEWNWVVTRGVEPDVTYHRWL